jgi:vacuolar-type H+-ATPase subunit H
MTNILDELYYGNIQQVFKKASNEYKEAHKKEMKLLAEFEKQLPKELEDLFEKYVTSCDDKNDIEVKDAYIQGLKTGLLIGIEASKIEL